MGLEKRKTTWKQLLRQHNSSFLHWADSNGMQSKAFCKLAFDLEKFIIRTLSCDESLSGKTEYLDKKKCNDFAENLPLVLANCDDDI